MQQIIDVFKKKDAKKQFEFFENEKPIANIDYPKRFSKTATITAGKNVWKIARTGFWKHYIEITSEQSPYTKWKVHQNWKSELTLRTDDNKLYSFKKAGFWKQRWLWHNETDQPVLELKACGWPQKKKGTVTFLTKKDDNLLWLSFVGFFLVMCAQEDAAAAVGTASV